MNPTHARHMHIGRAYFRVSRVSCTSVTLPQCAHASTRRRIPFAKYERPPQPWSSGPRPPRKPWPEASVAELEKELTWTARNKPSIPTVEALLRYLVDERRVQPTAAHYEALILANRDLDGSIHNVKAILSEMEEHGLPTSGLVDNAVLEVRLSGRKVEADAN